MTNARFLRSEVERLEAERDQARAVVAAQREALRRIAQGDTLGRGFQETARAALDAEGVSEPGGIRGHAPVHSGASDLNRAHGPGSLTSPVDGGKP